MATAAAGRIVQRGVSFNETVRGYLLKLAAYSSYNKSELFRFHVDPGGNRSIKQRREMFSIEQRINANST
jgi:hypothetical protein